MSKIYLGLGSNLGDQRANLETALQLLSEQVKIMKRSAFYESEPVGFADQPWFLNIVVEGETELDPEALLRFTQSIEAKMKRVKTVRFGPRTIDVDILLYEGETRETETLTIPHPRMKERAFVMVPLHEIAPDLRVGSQTVREILEDLHGEAIRRVDE